MKESAKSDPRKRVGNYIACAAPLAFGRSTQVFDLPARRFPFGHRLAGFRVPFFFVENSVVKLYCIWPRKRLSLIENEISFIATIYKRYLLDTEFFGLPCDIEFVEASAPLGEPDRVLARYTLEDLVLWSDRELSDRLTMITRALDAVETSDRLQPKIRQSRAPATDMPLFD